MNAIKMVRLVKMRSIKTGLVLAVAYPMFKRLVLRAEVSYAKMK